MGTLPVPHNACAPRAMRVPGTQQGVHAAASQLDFSGSHVFGRFDLFCCRIGKLIDMFNTIHQIRQLAVQLKPLNNIHKIVGNFKKIVDEFRKERHDLLDFCDNRFDRDYVEFNVRVSDLEVHLQQFNNEFSTSSPSIEASLRGLKKFQDIFHADGERIHSTLRTDLAPKLTIMLKNYGMELNEFQDTYEKNKHALPLVRNMPPVDGSILWARHLLSGPMQGFVAVSPSVLSATTEAKRITKTYNRMAMTLVEFEAIWHQAWVNSCDAAKSWPAGNVDSAPSRRQPALRELRLGNPAA